jgi:hypothetical protein
MSTFTSRPIDVNSKMPKDLDETPQLDGAIGHYTFSS